MKSYVSEISCFTGYTLVVLHSCQLSVYLASDCSRYGTKTEPPASPNIIVLEHCDGGWNRLDILRVGHG